ncbi:hypothetical protein ADM98_09570 [Exiguobacterium sp. BMC-KP]|nr:hypothetical protein ADM98_09570 [Exiguobacterium sp. BMC-KP]
MLSWLGIHKIEKQRRQFFGNIEKRTTTLVLLTSLLVSYGIKMLFTYLIPFAYSKDPIVAILPGIIGVLVAVIYVLVLERRLQEKHSENIKQS